MRAHVAEEKSKNHCSISSIIQLSENTLIYLISSVKDVKLVAYNFKENKQMAELVFLRSESEIDMAYLEKLAKSSHPNQFELYFPVPAYSKTVSSCFARARNTDADGFKVTTYQLNEDGFRALSSTNKTCTQLLAELDVSNITQKELALLKKTEEIIQKASIKAKMLKNAITNCNNFVETNDLYILSLYGEDSIYFINKSNYTFTMLNTSDAPRPEVMNDSSALRR